MLRPDAEGRANAFGLSSWPSPPLLISCTSVRADDGAPNEVPRSEGTGEAWRSLAASALFVVVALCLTWPLAARFTTHLGGDGGDPLQTLWSWSALFRALSHFENPFFTELLFAPHGASLVFCTFDLPTALLTLPLWWVLPPVAIYNIGVLFTCWLSAFGLYRLVLELTKSGDGTRSRARGDWGAAVVAGSLFLLVPYRAAHADGHLHLLAMGWLPLSLVHLHRLLFGRGQVRDALLGGLFLGLAALASWYHLLYALLLLPVLFGARALSREGALPIRMLLARLSIYALAAIAVAGPLMLAILLQRAREPIVGSHDAVRFSADLESFFLPNLAQRWPALIPWLRARAGRWSGNGAEIALYAGYLVALLALSGHFVLKGVGAAERRMRLQARVYLVVALLGALFALGPKLRLGGRLVELPFDLPYGWLARALPPIEFMGVPARFGYLLYLGLIVAGALTLSRLTRERPMALRCGLLCAVFALGAAEYAPKRLDLTSLTAPPPMERWARDAERYAVLDLSGWYRMMWHATIHGKPMPGGNLTRVPERLDRWYRELPIIRALSAGRCLGREKGRGALEALAVRYVVTRAGEQRCLSEELGLALYYEGEGLAIYELAAQPPALSPGAR